MKALQKFSSFALATVAAATLVACGGGGDDTDTPPPRSAAEGLWTNQFGGVLVTSTGEFWGLEYANSLGWILYQGKVTTSGSSFNGIGTAYYGTNKVNGTVSGTFTTSTMTVTLAAPGLGSQTANLVKNSIYNQTPSLSQLAGTYRASSGSTLTLTTAGDITGSVGSCTFSGRARTSDDGKNYLLFSLTYSSGCGTALAGKSSTGVVIPYGTNVAYFGEKLNDESAGAGGTLTKQ